MDKKNDIKIKINLTLIIYNYFTGKLREFYNYKPNSSIATLWMFEKLVERTRG